MSKPVSRYLPDTSATEALGAALARIIRSGAVIYLHGDLGAGKTTLVRGLLQALGHKGAVRSPTYTLIEPYQFDRLNAFHLDLYRLGDPEELDYLGIRELDDPAALVLIEWPERGHGWLPAADISLRLSMEKDGRNAEIAGHSEKGSELIKNL
ncbi:MAG TPA: tRNA (adenosine(37)-N6)-threonylcarbamoyltransferase complex ATPase subunit type 1 TsaE [Gammaproteobacteria bacterium]|nr:tRNA (adenosine(37)-N6)-threonylcarbamoyltransferase complex ATPase subunit type 1 TsaE [Gammaproteobacteria bacterium]